MKQEHGVARAGILGLMLMVAGAAAIAREPATGGKSIVESGSSHGAPACVSCHGAALQGNEAIKAPALAGRPAAYILARLGHYAGPDGHNPMMKQVATALSPAESKAVASYIAGLAPGAGKGG